MHPVTASRSTTWAWRPCPRTSRAAPACACTPPPCAAATVSARSKDCQEGLTRDVANASPSPASSPQSPSRPHSRRRGARTEAWTKSKQTRVRPAAPAPSSASSCPARRPRAYQTSPSRPSACLMVFAENCLLANRCFGCKRRGAYCPRKFLGGVVETDESYIQ